MIKINHQIPPFYPLRQGQRYTFPLYYTKRKILFFIFKKIFFLTIETELVKKNIFSSYSLLYAKNKC